MFLSFAQVITEMRNQEIENASDLRIFDDIERTSVERERYSASSFEFFNRSTWKSAGLIRDTLERWFAKVPPGKRKDLRQRLRGNDKEHSGALLELLTHELLSHCCRDVVVDPNISGGTPDFSAIHGRTQMIVECTVTQESDKVFGALKREREVLDVIDAINSGSYKFMVEPRRVGTQSPRQVLLKRHLEEGLASVIARGAVADNVADLMQQVQDHPIVWKWQDWELHFGVIEIEKNSEGGAIGGRHSRPQRVVDDTIIARALDKKAEAYRQPGMPYLVVVAQREGLGDGEDLKNALFGRERLLLDEITGEVSEHRLFNGFFGSPKNPRRTHVSAVLFKRTLRSAWDIRNQWNLPGFGTNISGYQSPDWIMVHHPEAANPLPEGIFPFADEHAWHSETQTRIEPTLTLNAVLGLPDDWPGEEH